MPSRHPTPPNPPCHRLVSLLDPRPPPLPPPNLQQLPLRQQHDHLDEISPVPTIQVMAGSCHSVEDSSMDHLVDGPVIRLAMLRKEHIRRRSKIDSIERGNDCRMSKKLVWLVCALRLLRGKRRFGKLERLKRGKRSRNDLPMLDKPRSIQRVSRKRTNVWIKRIEINSGDTSIVILHILQRRLRMMLCSKLRLGENRARMNTRRIQGIINTLQGINDLEWMLPSTMLGEETPTSQKGVKTRIDLNPRFEYAISVI
jgi:hypothetical protein